jgi:large subunit ribosomal protein L2
MFRRVGGGLPVYWYFVDFKRVGPTSGPPLVEKVIEIIKSRDRTAYIALVAHADSKRYILATQNMKIGDLIRTSCEIPRVTVKANEGDAYPLGALPIGAKIHNIEQIPGLGGTYCHAAGSSAEIISNIEDRVIVRLPSNLELSLDKKCMATVGQLSHADYKDEKLSHPVDNRDLGYRPRSGLWHRKDGYCGRKVHPAKPVKVINESSKLKKLAPQKIKYTFMNWSLEN